MWTAKLAGKPVPSRAAEGGVRMKSAFVGLVLGIDPSLRGTGLALVEFRTGCAPVLLRCRTVKVPPSRTTAFALGEIHRAVDEFIAASAAIRHVAMEQTIYVQNVRTAQTLGAARGAAIAAAALRGLPVFEYPPLRVKQAVSGMGRASKEQLSRTIGSILGHLGTRTLDESDAAGVALCHAFTWQP